MKKKKQIIVVDTRCYQCGMSSTDTFLERVKGTDLYVCEYCSPPSETESYKSDPMDDESEEQDDSDSGMIGGGGFGYSGRGRRNSDYDGYDNDDDYY